MAGVNKVILVGNLGADPEVRNLDNDRKVANLRLATTETYKDRVTGEKRDQTEWHTVSLWRGLATVAENYLKKGSQVYIEGKLRTRQWQDKEGNNRYTTEIIGETMQLLGRKGEGQNAQPQTTGTLNTVPQPAPLSPDLTDGSDLPF